jgi:hypothetical protein
MEKISFVKDPFNNFEVITKSVIFKYQFNLGYLILLIPYDFFLIFVIKYHRVIGKTTNKDLK